MRRLLAILIFVALAAPLPVAAQSAGLPTHASGTLELVMSDSLTGQTPDEYSLGNGIENVPLVVDGNARAKVGAQVAFDGTLLPDGRIAVAAEAIHVVSAAASPAVRPALATRNIAVIIGYYTDLAGLPVTTGEAATAMTGSPASVKTYFEATSRGLTSITATIYGPYALGIPQCPANTIFANSQSRAYAAAAANGVSLAGFDNVVLWTKAPCGVSWIGQGYVPGNYVQVLTDYAIYPDDEPAIAADVIAHELGHNLGLQHSQGLACFDGSNNETVTGTGCYYAPYADEYSTMGMSGDPSHSLLDADRLRTLGWLAPAESQTVSAVGTYTVVPTYSATAGVRLLRLAAPNPVDSGTSGFWTLELRSVLAGSWDQFTSYSAPVTTGVTIRYSENPSGFGYSYLADSTPDGSYTSGIDYWDAPFQPGSVFTDPYGGISVTVNSVSGSGASVTIGDSKAPGAPPTLTAVPNAGGGALLTWTAATDNLGLANYRVYRDGSLLGELSASTLTFTDPPVAGLSGLHHYTVKAVDTAGLAGPAAAADATLTSVPAAPTGVSAVPGNSAALVSWTAPADGGSPITGYTVTSTPGSFTCTTTGARSCVVSGLTNGQGYQFSVTATNVKGTGPASDLSASVTPLSVPGRPTDVAGTPGDAQVAVTWAAPSDLGGGTFSGYLVTASPGGQTCSSPTASGCTVTGLTNGNPYTFTVTASSSLGAGLPSDASSSITPRTVPGKPRTVTAVTADASATVSWLAPLDNGGSSIASYTVTSSPDSLTCTTSGLSCTVSGLTNHQQYTFTVVATNGAGPGAASDPSGVYTPLSGATYFPVDPNRLVDSRPAYLKGVGGSLTSNVPVSFQVTNRVPGDSSKNIPSNAVAVTGNLTVAGNASSGYFSLTPSRPSGIPSVSTLNFPPGDNRANGVTVLLGAGGVLWVTYEGIKGPADVVFDVTGYFLPNATGATYKAVEPNRLVDSRPAYLKGVGGSLTSNVPVSFQVTNRVPGDAARNIPSNAVAVTGNLTVAGNRSSGYFSLTPNRPPGIPPVSTLNFPPGDNRANGVTVQLGAGGVLWVTYEGVKGPADVVFDVTGYFVPDATGATYKAVDPNRLVDSRPAYLRGVGGSLTANVPVSFQVTNRVAGDAAKNIPSNAVAITGNLTVAGNRSSGYFSLTPTMPSGVPGVSTLNFPPGDNRANGVTVQLGGGGVLWVTYEGVNGPADVVFDVTGYFTM